MEYRLTSIKGGEVTEENGQKMISMGISSIAIVRLAQQEYKAGKKDVAVDILASAWPRITHWAMQKIWDEDIELVYDSDGGDVVKITLED